MSKVLLKKFVSIRFPKHPPVTFSVVCEQTDKYAIVMFSSTSSVDRTRSYLNSAVGPTRKDAFASSKYIIEHVKSTNPSVKKIHGIVTKTFDTAEAAEIAESRMEKQFVHELL